MKKRIIFRADGDASTGLGHLYRLFGLVEVLKDSFDFVFVTKASSTFSVIPKSYKTHFIPEHIDFKDEVTWLSQSYNPNDHITIVDGYQFNSTYQKKIKDKGYTLVYIDDLASEHIFADLVINHSPYLTEKHYKKEPYTKLALGTRYALLRPGFLKEAKLERNIKSIDSAFVCFGGADPFNLTYKAVTALLQLNRIKKISVVLGGAYKFNEILELKNTHPLKIDLYKNLSENELIKVMKNCNFAIVPASTILFEICCIKMPVLSGFYVENQELIYKGFLNKKSIYEGGDMSKFKALDFHRIVKNLLLKNDYSLYVSHQKVLFDKMIKERHVNLIKSLC
ncbi:UDP-2,4-diacetamido-2,4,6-trideoxy-beta-L-altropyranose hydrolase [Winogradskyella sp. J14-2]|uniref:UDP-2,4-diacetamido-2,4, 6-trideoxy-beta-L-altropyranose hydrolase n=1 Tax=Winogradskyella sp. J14-2 TaxID=1936080 RepID=UPI0009726FEF|nr:UDP-2,4-diacetamido-2,4,6-trideoxy-beta-L-altropyranose hydrolase [Winogradskyella sp. J14-2]APY08478.1 UDP-2,4-diacetamido-2,4,6-trideoxy-beta-L-altropyranose hydrolase [Winogradskyella sp. J14-2]